MKSSRRATRMQRHHRRNKAAGTLNLTALMDIFTILVFFLMVNQSDVQVQNSDSVALPVSTSDKAPNENLIVLLTRDQVLVQGRHAGDIQQIREDDGEVIESLKNELEFYASQTPTTGEATEQRLPITIVGDKGTPYSVLKKVINTCAKSGFSDVSLAVNHQQQGGE